MPSSLVITILMMTLVLLIRVGAGASTFGGLDSFHAVNLNEEVYRKFSEYCRENTINLNFSTNQSYLSNLNKLKATKKLPGPTPNNELPLTKVPFKVSTAIAQEV